MYGFIEFEATANKSINERDGSAYSLRLWSFGNSTGVGKWEFDLEIPTAQNEGASDQFQLSTIILALHK